MGHRCHRRWPEAASLWPNLASSGHDSAAFLDMEQLLPNLANAATSWSDLATAATTRPPWSDLVGGFRSNEGCCTVAKLGHI